MADRGPARVDAVLSGFLGRHGLDGQIQRMEIVDLWPTLVGEHVADVTSVRGVEEATLLVEVRSSAWLMELNMMKAEILERVNERFVDIPFERMVFVLAETG